MERSFHVTLQEDVGYIVTLVEMEENREFISSFLICNFGMFRADAEKFRTDCEKGIVSEKRLKQLTGANYTDTPYEYLGNGHLKPQE